MMEVLESDEKYTYADYITWDSKMRYELIDGIPHMMSPSPNQGHQYISAFLVAKLFDFLEDKPCQVFSAPFDVRLNATHGDNTVVQPDVLVVCDDSKLDGECCNGAPDLVVEILSPSSSYCDITVKYQKYLEAGVREYWLIDPAEKNVKTFVLQDNLYIESLYENLGTIPVSVLGGFEINLERLFTKRRNAK